MKSPAPSTLQAALEKCHAIDSEISSLRRFSDEAARRLQELENNWDLDDAKGLLEIGSLQVKSNLLPRKIGARENALETAKNVDLLESCHNHVTQTLSPAVRKAVEIARKKVRAQLRQVMSEGHDLETAIDHSDLVMEAE